MANPFGNAVHTIYGDLQNLTTRLHDLLFGAGSTSAFNTFRSQTVQAFGQLESLVELEAELSAGRINDAIRVLTEAEHWSFDNFRTVTGVITPNQIARTAAGLTTARIEAVNHTREQAAAALAGEVKARVEAVNHTREQAAALVAGEAKARIEAIDHTRQQVAAAIAQEATARTLGDQHSREQAAAAVKALDQRLTAQIQQVLEYAQSLPGLIDTRAANGYDPTLRARAGLLQRLLDTVTAHDPAIAGLVSDLAKLAVELAGIDDPLLKITATVLLKQVIDRLGVDSALQAMLGDLLGGIIGGGQPKTLTAVVADIGNRLDALESGQANLSPLAPEADILHTLGTLTFDAAMLAYLAAAVGDPVATANDTVGTLAPVTSPLLAPIRAMLGVGS